MAWWIWALIAVYGAGFFFTFYVIATVMGNYTLGLMLLCSFLWPLWWGSRGRWPAGEQQAGPD